MPRFLNASVTPQSIGFDGSTQYASIADGSQTGLNLGSDDFLITLWLKIQNGSTLQDIMNKNNGSGYVTAANTGWDLLYRGDHAGHPLNFRISNGTSTTASFDSTPTVNKYKLDNGQWHHIGISGKRGGAGLVHLYIDGNDLGSETFASISGSISSTGVFRIGARNDGTVKTLGNIKDVAIYDFGVGGMPGDNGLSIIQNIYYQGIYSATGLVSKWTFNNTPNDSVGSNNLTLTGSPSYSSNVPSQFTARTLAGVRTLIPIARTLAGTRIKVT